MKKNPILAAASAALLVLAAASCGKDASAGGAAPVPSVPVSLSVGIHGSGTKVTGVTSNDPATEAKVNTLQVLVFKDGGLTLDGYASVSGADHLSVDCTAGERKVYAVVNAADLSAVAKESELLSTVSALANEVSNFQMIGSLTATVKQDAAVSVSVRRLASRIVLRSIKNSLPNAAQAGSFFIEAVYLTNAAGDAPFSTDPSYAVSSWYNKRGYQASNNLGSFTFDAVTDASSSPVKVNAGASYSVPHFLYAYPNASTDASCKAAAYSSLTDAELGLAAGATEAQRSEAIQALPLPDSWSPRSTRLVVKALIDGEHYVYPIPLPVLQGNRSYEIDILELTRLGNRSDSDEPTDGEPSEEEQDVEGVAQGFRITVTDWDVVLIGADGSFGGSNDGHFTI